MTGRLRTKLRAAAFALGLALIEFAGVTEQDVHLVFTAKLRRMQRAAKRRAPLVVLLAAGLTLASCAHSPRTIVREPAPRQVAPPCPAGSRLLYVEQLSGDRVCEWVRE